MVVTSASLTALGGSCGLEGIYIRRNFSPTPSGTNAAANVIGYVRNKHILRSDAIISAPSEFQA
jgi:hypothetical protein